MNNIQFFLILLWILGSGACESTSEEIANRTKAAQKAGQNTTVPDGMAVFRQNCVICHGSDGQLGLNGAKDLTQSERPLEERIQIITQGKNLMTPFRTILSPEEIAAVAAYTLTFKKMN